MLRSFGTAVSGLQAAQAGLYVTGHNMANASTVGYTRQQSLQQDFGYQSIGSNYWGNLKVGLGTDIACIRQIRNDYLDSMYRKEVGKATYYSALYMTGNELEKILGELESAYSTQSVINRLWSSINDLITHPSGPETRSNFISSATTYLNRMTNSYNSMIAEQQNLNTEIIKAVDEINKYTQQIHELNQIILKQEASGQNANDYRDARNHCLDELSRLVNIEYKENAKGEVEVFTNGKELVCNGTVNKLGLRYTSANSSLVEPVFTNAAHILEYDPTYKNARTLFNYVGGTYENSAYGGELYGLIMARGLFSPDGTGVAFSVPDYTALVPGFTPVVQPPNPGDYTGGADSKEYMDAYRLYLRTLENELNTYGSALTGAALTDFNTYMTQEFNPYKEQSDTYMRLLQFNNTKCTLTTTMNELDQLFTYIADLINEELSQGYDLNNQQSGTLIFVPADSGKPLSLYNVMLNPDLLTSDGYNLLCLSDKPNQLDNGEHVKSLLEKWKKAESIIAGADDMTIDDAYRHIINTVAVNTNKALSYYSSQVTVVNDIDQKRQAISGVSLDEEMSNMLKFQHAYNASSRVINVLDSMIDKLINGTGRVGL